MSSAEQLQEKPPFSERVDRFTLVANKWLKRSFIALGLGLSLATLGNAVYDTVEDGPVKVDLEVTGAMLGFTALGGGLLELDQRRFEKQFEQRYAVAKPAPEDV